MTALLLSAQGILRLVWVFFFNFNSPLPPWSFAQRAGRMTGRTVPSSHHCARCRARAAFGPCLQQSQPAGAPCGPRLPRSVVTGDVTQASDPPSGAAHRHVNARRAHALQGQCDNCGEDNGQGLTTSRSRGSQEPRFNHQTAQMGYNFVKAIHRGATARVSNQAFLQ